MANEEEFRRLLGRLPVEGAHRLESILGRISEGFPKVSPNLPEDEQLKIRLTKGDLIAPLYKDLSREEFITKLEEDIGYTDFEDLTEIEKHEKEKFGPYSIMLPSKDRESNLVKYWDQAFSPDEDALRQAVILVSKLLPKRSLRPSGFDEAFNMMPKDTSLGLPWLTRDRKYAPWYLQRAREITSPEEIYPCVWYWRGQPRGLWEIPKQRDVWGFDHTETIIGATILYPLLNALRQRRGFAAWRGGPYVDEEATELLNTSRGRRIISSDFSGFDSSLSIGLLNLVDEVIKFWFVDDVHPRIDLLGRISATVPIVVPYSIWDGRNGGMPSGSVLTNMRDTIANLIAGYYCAIRHNTNLERFMVLGDDAVYLFRDEVSAEDYATSMNELGLDSNPEKQFISTDALHYLQRWHSLRYSVSGVCVGVHSPYRSASGLKGYERFKKDWSGDMDTVRWIMQTENCCNHPLFRKLCGFVYHGDKNLLQGTDIVTIFARAGGSDKIRSVLDIASFPFNSKNPDLVKEFRTTTIIRELQRSKG